MAAELYASVVRGGGPSCWRAQSLPAPVADLGDGSLGPARLPAAKRRVNFKGGTQVWKSHRVRARLFTTHAERSAHSHPKCLSATEEQGAPSPGDTPRSGTGWDREHPHKAEIAPEPLQLPPPCCSGVKQPARSVTATLRVTATLHAPPS